MPAPSPSATPSILPEPAPPLRLTSSQEVSFLGDVSEERQAEIRQAVEEVMSFFDDRYGVVVPALQAVPLTGPGSSR